VTEERRFKTTGKVDVDDLYAAPTPAAYVRFLYEHDYRLPGHATPILRSVLARLRERRKRDALRVLDLGCSYGIMSACLRHDLGLGDLYRHYHAGYDTARPLDAIYDDDAHFFAAGRRDDRLVLVGIDPAEPAVDYARAVGLVDDGCARSLEDDAPLPDTLAAMLSGHDLIFSTGVIGYAGLRTIERLLALNAASRPWLLNFVLRGVDYHPIAQFLAGQGYVTARDAHVHRQRRFAGAEEQARWLENLRRQGVDPAGYESTGYSCAALYLSRPAAEAEGPPGLATALL
jgi:SAM-dependent methyltransferase